MRELESFDESCAPGKGSGRDSISSSFGTGPGSCWLKLEQSIMQERKDARGTAQFIDPEIRVSKAGKG